VSNQEWSDAQPVGGSPMQVIARAAIGMEREEYQLERQRSERIAMAQERREELAYAFQRQGIPIPSNYDVFQRAAAVDATSGREFERQRAARQMQHEGRMMERELAGMGPRTHAEVLEGFSRSCVVHDAAVARAEHEAKMNAAAPIDVSQRALQKAQADRRAEAQSTPATLLDVREAESAAQQTISKLKAKLHAHGWLPTG
jgi:hypothetical protein